MSHPGPAAEISIFSTGGEGDGVRYRLIEFIGFTNLSRNRVAFFRAGGTGDLLIASLYLLLVLCVHGVPEGFFA